ncbi:MAG: hypothetical protein IPN76_03560 [Saprospiraceae bacterium]|nr:hypothetical protein [Saprospiraceae bacterium]
MPGNYLQSRIIEDGEGNLWTTTYEALVCYVRKHDHFRSFHYKGQKGYHLSFMDNQGRLGLIVGGNNFCYFHPTESAWDSICQLPPPSQRMAPNFKENGDLRTLAVFGYDRPGIHFLTFGANGNIVSQKRFSGENGDPSFLASDGLEEGDSTWFTVNSGLLLVLPGGAWQLYPVEGGRPNKLASYDRYHLMASIYGGGWQFFNKKAMGDGTRFANDPSDRWSLANNMTYGVWKDNHGVIWTGVNGIGVDFTQPKKVKFGLTDLRRLWENTDNMNGIFAIDEDSQGNVWCSSRSLGVFVLSEIKAPLAHFSIGDKQGQTTHSNDIFYLFVDRKDRCWAFSFDKGLAVKGPDDKGFQPVLPDSIFLYGYELANGRLVFSSMAGGLYLLNENSSGYLFEKLEKAGNGAFTHIYQNKKGLLLASREQTSIEVLAPEKGFAMTTSLPIGGDVLGYYEDPASDTLWIGTSNGLVSLDQKTWLHKTYTEADGLPDQHVYAVLGNAADTLWLSTNRGIVRFLVKERQFHGFDMPDGLQGLEFNSHGFLRRSNGEFWFAGRNGINHFKPEQIKMLETKPQVQFTRLLVNNVEVPHPICRATSATNISEVKKLVFKSHENTLNFEFAALEFSNPSKNQFRYKLENYESEWAPATTQGFARYANLPPGRYILKVKASNSDGIWSAEKRLEIIIKRPFWLQWWFLLLALSAAGAVGYGTYRWRIGQLLGVERLRNQISIDLHDDIGATLSNVNILTTLIRQKLPADSEALPLLDRIEEEVQASAESLDDIIWSINPKNDPLDRVLARMRRFATEAFEAKGINGSLQFPLDAKRLRLDMGKRRQFYLLFKEAVNNLVKYSQCQSANISVLHEQGKLSMTIHDDGLGFDPMSVKEGGNGLLTMRQRAKNLGGELQLTTAPGRGTTVRVRFPIKEIRD